MAGRRRIRIDGIVQGTGLGGYVLSDAAGVTMELGGEPDRVNCFTSCLASEAPPLAVIERLTTDKLPPGQKRAQPRRFAIVPRREAEAENVFISPDVATCPGCLAKLRDPADRRYRYPFTNCTQCGPASPSFETYRTTGRRRRWRPLPCGRNLALWRFRWNFCPERFVWRERSVVGRSRSWPIGYR